MKPAFLLLLVAVMLVSGCDRESSTRTPAVEVRGQPISRIADKTPAPPAPSIVAAPAAIARPDPQDTAPEFASAGFDILSGYNIEISDDLLGPVTNDVAAATAKTESLIPTTVKAFNKKRVALQGFMLPLKVEGGLVTEMLIM